MLPFSVFPLPDCLLVSIQEEIDDAGIASLIDNIGEMAQKYQARGVIIDLHDVEVVDSYLANNLEELTISLNLMRTKVVIVGLAVPVVITLLDFGIELKGVEFALDVEQGLNRINDK
jgi:rsbT antagonist protein RsbS